MSSPSDGAVERSTLDGLLVLDLTQFLAGPHCTQVLADLGATVIKVEPPSGDSTRRLPPYFIGETSAYFCSANRDKQSIVIDLKEPRGRGICLELAKRADVLVENFRPGVLERLGLGYEEVKAVNDDIVFCSISGFGQSGPMSDKPAYDAVVQALAGTMSITGEPGQRPVRMGAPLGDLAAGMYAAIGLLSALARRNATGAGAYVDVAMFDAQLAMLSYQASYYLLSGDVPGPQGRGHVSIPTYRSFTCGDGAELMVTANTEAMWQALCETLGVPGLASEAQFKTNAERLTNREALWELLEPRFLERPVDEWADALLAVGVPSARVNTVDRALAEPMVVSRGLVVDATDRHGRQTRLLGNPIKIAGADGKADPSHIPELGEDTAAVLRDVLGLDAGEIEELIAAGAVIAAPPAG